ncbi:hypothetical protein T265_06133 [Opisthorchis viverrini]|uniref:Uncharacterized protein n=1 Tax=Opisthorchis viverrini TaxID=6198 RepID=A0A074ZHD3_OPIVI|nr:hypothetical protein T265_06133 [Opisthorchis viverrini]KER26628.1 hypothetical protein T265_06133 [Opisthorchis viverrini]
MHGEKGPKNIMRIDAKKDLGIWVSSYLSFTLHHEKSAQKAVAIMRMIRRTFSRITRMDFQILYGAYVGPLLECANQVVYSGRTKDVTLIERVQRAATRMVAGPKSVDYETRLAMLDLFPLEYRRPRGDVIPTYALFEQSLANRFFTVEQANTRRGNTTDRQELNQPGKLGQKRRSCVSIRESVNLGGRLLHLIVLVLRLLDERTNITKLSFTYSFKVFSNAVKYENDTPTNFSKEATSEAIADEVQSRILALASILSRAENIKITDRQGKSDPGNLSKSLDHVYQSMNPIEVEVVCKNHRTNFDNSTSALARK